MHETEILLRTLQEDVNLRHASPEALDRLAQNARRVAYEKGDYVFDAGDPADYYYLVESGRVVLAKESPSGKVFTFMIALRGRPLNAITCFKSGVRFFSARVAEKAVLIAIPCHVFKAWVLDNPDVVAGILTTMGNLLDGAYTRILDIIDESAEKRVLNSLVMLSARVGTELPLTNNDVAEMTGVSRETAARVISRLQEGGLLEKSRGSIRILNLEQLEELSTSPFFVL